MANFTRRKFLQATGGAVAVSSLGFPAIVGAARRRPSPAGGPSTLALARVAATAPERPAGQPRPPTWTGSPGDE